MEKDAATDDQRAQRIIDCVNDLLRRDDRLVRKDNGRYAVLTDIGCSFTFEVTGDSRLEAAQSYFLHVYDVLDYIPRKRSGPLGLLDALRSLRGPDRRRQLNQDAKRAMLEFVTKR